MAHISPVGRNSWRVRTGLGALYVALILGAITTVYPFLMMVSTGTKSQVDYNEFTPQAIIPLYWRDDRMLYVKYIEDRYANDLDEIAGAFHGDTIPVAQVTPPANVNVPETRALVDDWSRFAATLPATAVKAGFGEHDNAPSRLLLLYRQHTRDIFHGDIEALNKAWTEENVSFDGVTPPFERTALRSWTPKLTLPKVRDWYAYKQTLPQDFRLVSLADPLYRTYLRQDVYDDDLKKLNAAWGADIKRWGDITLARQVDAVPTAQRPDWEKFLRTKFPLRTLTVDESALPAWRAFLASHNRAGAASASLPKEVPSGGDALSDWMEFIGSPAPINALAADSAENLWRAQLAKTYSTVDAANKAFGTSWKNWGEAQPPVPEADWLYVMAHKGELRSEFATRNFRAVSDYILLHGNAVGNTVIFCVLSILAAVIVNPLCAYALSRYPLPYAYKVLLFLLATMAFPAEVAMIPNFLLLRSLHLLNTFWALILPGLASGFSIFLLKGFFDSLPKELYEAGILDGATEVTMFRAITVPLSLPIFSVIALDAFTASYGAFLFAMVTCQNPKMWTLMVWLYNMQDTSPPYVVMAALTLAAIPTLLVFLAAQKVIMRGIILPSFK